MPPRAAGSRRALPNGCWYDALCMSEPPRPRSPTEDQAEVVHQIRRNQAAERIREARRKLGIQPQVDPYQSPPKSKKNHQTKLMSSARRRDGRLDRSSTLSDRKGIGTSGNGEKAASLTPPSSASGKAARGKGPAIVSDDHYILIKSSEIYKEVQHIEQQAVELDAMAAHRADAGSRDTFERRLGAALMAQTKPLSELMRDWDKNGDGDINTIEFRACVRNSLGLKSNNEEIDGWFSTVDLDGGGSLDFPELKAAFKSLRKRLGADRDEITRCREEAEEIRRKAAEVEEIAKVTQELEAAKRRLVELEKEPPLEARLGAVMAKRNMKAADVVSQWDRNNDKSISREEFHENVALMGVAADSAEVDARGSDSNHPLSQRPLSLLPLLAWCWSERDGTPHAWVLVRVGLPLSCVPRFLSRVCHSRSTL